ncbi:hypothetical protein LEP1GSC050_1295 [Leptospira broomii serovar Hurstbridge str. 5399]|uniref:PHP domain protein n=1 Tax=Leptospira broomii serovar Hurstbridge str. 5399 TaxID=1049789 RepID=T0EX52_9LEPT|nr:hypothetical protein [Leptospira broomii]EQA43475.1 hypothetical protein LEP1GSC050_1295 [Leptospira broomii serovar Hurstbridge str. 5399]
MNFRNWKRSLLGLFVTIIVTVLSFNAWSLFFLRSDIRPKQASNNIQSIGREIHDPYLRSTKLKWIKTAIHLHSNRAWFTPIRNSPEEIQEVYSKNGYQILAFTDYEIVTKLESKKTALIPGYEWGRNLVKRHLTVLGIEEADHDFFPLFAFPENIQWEIDSLQKKGAFVAINHPLLNDSFPLRILEKLSGYNAIEVLSPFGDILTYWDQLLSLGVSSFCMAGDDLHYLPKEEYLKVAKTGFPSLRQIATEWYDEDGESLMRYILLNANSTDKEDILAALKEGNYACVRKMSRVLSDPKVKAFGIRNGAEVFYEFDETPLTVDFIGRNGETLSRSYGQKKGTYRFRPDDLYVRIQAFLPTGLILSNPFYRK